jgi:hypothetical protein
LKQCCPTFPNVLHLHLITRLSETSTPDEELTVVSDRPHGTVDRTCVESEGNDADCNGQWD